MTGPLRFPDVEVVIADVIADLFGGPEHTGGETPADLAGLLPFARVLRIDGPTGRTDDFALVEVDVFAELRTVGKPLADDVRDFLTQRRPPSPLLDRIACDIGPRELPWGDGVIRRWGATYTVTSRRRVAS